MMTIIFVLHLISHSSLLLACDTELGLSDTILVSSHILFFPNIC